MKVSGPNNLGSAPPARGTSRAAGGFSLGEAAQTRGAAPAAMASPAGPVAGLDALIALQAMGGPLERRRRAVGRAGRILDVLDAVKIALPVEPTNRAARS